MENQVKHNPSNFWVGFASGITLGLFLAFLLGTKKGRQYLKETIELSEKLEENLSTIITELEEKFEKKGESFLSSINHQVKKHETNTISSLLNKIKNHLTF